MATIASLIVAEKAAGRVALGRLCTKCGEWKPWGEFHTRRGGKHRADCKSCACAARRSIYDSARAKAYQAEYKANWRNLTTYEARTCTHCGVEFPFYKPLNGSRPGQGRFCSLACKSASRRKVVRCATCATDFEVWRCSKRKYCSLECAGRITSKTLTHGPHVYGSRSWAAIRQTVIERDGYCCQRCRATTRLIVHHIVPFKVSRDNSYENLVTVCRGCHAAIHAAAPFDEYIPVLPIGGAF